MKSGFFFLLGVLATFLGLAIMGLISHSLNGNTNLPKKGSVYWFIGPKDATGEVGRVLDVCRKGATWVLIQPGVPSHHQDGHREVLDSSFEGSTVGMAQEWIRLESFDKCFQLVEPPTKSTAK
ncbi:MAG TPA: hypothetical protein VIM58_01235 [Candidatus Methylacidiphilales bacterium]